MLLRLTTFVNKRLQLRHFDQFNPLLSGIDAKGKILAQLRVEEK